MSGLLAGKVWQSALEPHLKPLAAALADIGNDDGTSIYPSVAYLAWLMGRSERSIQDGLAALRSGGVLVVIMQGGGRYRTTEYQLIEAKLPVREPWRKGATAAGFQRERVQRTTQKGEAGCTRTVSEPSRDIYLVRDDPIRFFEERYKRCHL